MARRAGLFVRELSDGEAAHLLQLSKRGPNAVARHRAMLLFASYQGQSVGQISLMFQASATHVAALIHAFNEQGLKVALARPADRGEPFTRWSLTKLRAHLVRSRIVPAISRSELWRILHEAGVRFTHHKTWKASPDPEFETKKNRILDLYAHPPAGARVLCLDEFGPLNLQPRLGHGWHPVGEPARFRATYKRTAGVRQLVAAYDPATGALYGHLHDRKTWREIRELLRSLRARFDERLIVVLDNFSPHKKHELGAWVADHDIELVFTPTYSSWLNLIECQFQGTPLLRPQRLRLSEPRRAGRRDPCLPALAQPERSTGQGLASQRRGPPFAPQRCGMRH